MAGNVLSDTRQRKKRKGEEKIQLLLALIEDWTTEEEC